ncbi:hypothetical protein [Nocardiopsis salina]|uniref:hypothetical protein n=1 Tax=Nocardiopsis salina TaxID=245836 RepID=UPI00036E8FDE|nr:hypothetical protein [Nocardiopsis salina]
MTPTVPATTAPAACTHTAGRRHRSASGSHPTRKACATAHTTHAGTSSPNAHGSGSPCHSAHAGITASITAVVARLWRTYRDTTRSAEAVGPSGARGSPTGPLGPDSERTGPPVGA